MEEATSKDWDVLHVGSTVEVFMEHRTEDGWERIGAADEISPLRWTGVVVSTPSVTKYGHIFSESTVNVLPDDAVVTAAGFDNGHPLLLDRQQVKLESVQRETGEPFKRLVRTAVRLAVTSGQNP